MMRPETSAPRAISWYHPTHRDFPLRWMSEKSGNSCSLRLWSSPCAPQASSPSGQDDRSLLLLPSGLSSPGSGLSSDCFWRSQGTQEAGGWEEGAKDQRTKTSPTDNQLWNKRDQETIQARHCEPGLPAGGGEAAPHCHLEIWLLLLLIQRGTILQDSEW